MVKIILRNDKGKLECTVERLKKLRDRFRIRVPGAWYSPAYRNRSWDGFAYYITNAGYFYMGLLPKLLNILKEFDWEYDINDLRETVLPTKLVTKFGKVTLRDYQLAAVKSIIYNEIDDEISFQRGILNEATNAGKTLMAVSLFKSYPDHLKLIFVVNRQHLYLSLRKEIIELIGNKELGYIGPDGVKWNRFMICMAQTLSKGNYTNRLHEFDIAIIDECHYASSNTYKYILGALENSSVRVGLSGTPLMHKDKNKNEKILSFFGPETHITTNKELIDAGFSTPPLITIRPGNTKVKVSGDYKKEETDGLVFSKERNKRILRRMQFHIDRDRYPLLLIAKYHNHTELLYDKVKKAFPHLRVNYIHVKIKDRIKILNRFKEGKIDILVSSKLIKEGQNLPLIRAMVFACGGDSLIDLIQLIGRNLRKHKSKDKVYFDDFYDQGYYLERHSKHRLKELKKQGFKVIEKYEKEKAK